MIAVHVPPPHLTCRRPDVADEIPDPDYDYINVFQEGNLETSTENPQPSTVWNDASEVQFELTPCEAYGPVTLSPHDSY